MRRLYLYGGSLIALAAFAATGQPSAAFAATVEQPADAQRLEEVVVVARRTEERLQDVPISVTAISAESLKQTQITTSADLIKVVPTLNVQQLATGNGPSYSLRGIRTGVVTYFNEVATGSSSIEDQLWDLSSVQALAGPQGTLFGRNSTGGAILFVPQRPTGDFGGYVEASLGNYAYRQLTGVANIPVNDKIQVRVGGRVIRRGGFVDNLIGPDFQSLGRDVFRASVVLEPTDRISNYTVFDYSKRDELPILQVSSDFTANLGCAPGLGCTIYPPGLLLQLGNEQTALGIRTTKSSYPAFNKSEYYGVSNIFAYNLLENLTFKYIFGYRYEDFEDQSTKFSADAPLELGWTFSTSESWSHEAQLQGSFFDGRLNTTVGAYYSRRKNLNPGGGFALFLAPGSQVSFDRIVGNPGVSKGEAKAVFAQATLKVTDKLNFTAGIRRNNDESNQVVGRRGPQFTFFGPNVCLLPVGGVGVDLVACRRTLNGKWDATTYNVSVDYRVNDSFMAYATTRRGYNAGGFNASVVTPSPSLKITYDPEYLTDYEVGIKADWMIGDMPLRTNISVFRADYTEIQRAGRGFDSLNRPFSVTQNLADARIEGVQLESVFRPLPELTLNLNYGYLKAKYLTGTDTFSKANQFAQAPEHSVNASATYRKDLAPGGQLVGTLSYAYQSEITFTDANTLPNGAKAPFVFQKGYGIWDGRVGWDRVGGGPANVGFFVKNIADEVYAIDRQDTTGIFGFVGTVYNEPRTFGVEVKYSFGG